jgi:hypothetical protein
MLQKIIMQQIAERVKTWNMGRQFVQSLERFQSPTVVFRMAEHSFHPRVTDNRRHSGWERHMAELQRSTVDQERVVLPCKCACKLVHDSTEDAGEFLFSQLAEFGNFNVGEGGVVE